MTAKRAGSGGLDCLKSFKTVKKKGESSLARQPAPWSRGAGQGGQVGAPSPSSQDRNWVQSSVSRTTTLSSPQKWWRALRELRGGAASRPGRPPRPVFRGGPEPLPAPTLTGRGVACPGSELQSGAVCYASSRAGKQEAPTGKIQREHCGQTTFGTCSWTLVLGRKGHLQITTGPPEPSLSKIKPTA